MAIILQGDKLKAAAWVPWAKNQLQRLRRISGVVNQIYRPKGGVGIHVRSGAGIDRIRIVVAQKIGCRNDFLYGFSFFNPDPFEVAFANSHWVDGKKLPPPAAPFWGWYDFGNGHTTAINSTGTPVEGFRTHRYTSAGDYIVKLYSIKRDFIGDDVIPLTSFNISATEAVFTIDTTGNTKAIGQLAFGLSFALTIADITVTIDGGLVEITTDAFTPNRDVHILSTATGGVMTAVVTWLTPTGATNWMPSRNWGFIRYKCLATKTKTITVT